jgi:SpoVK/Ycf46/Vps4 family AAA+-type ATPase
MLLADRSSAASSSTELIAKEQNSSNITFVWRFTMPTNRPLVFEGIPEGNAAGHAGVLRSRLATSINEFLDDVRLQDIEITIGTPALMQKRTPPMAARNGNEPEAQSKGSDDPPIEERARQYETIQPRFRFDQLIVTEEVMEDLLSAIEIIRLERKVFDEWGLREIEPYPRTALNFHGKPGTGKTLAAHAIAHNLGRPILVASYAEIESKFHGDGPKNVKAIFHAAERDNAVLFIDEADSLLSKRLTNVTQGSEQAINSMRSQLLICLEQFQGVVIFATNLVTNYDKAFETRVRHIHFPLPDADCRARIWKIHLVPLLPVASDVSPATLASLADDVCGRDIKNAVIDAAIRAARHDKLPIETQDFIAAIDRIKAARIKDEEEGRPLTEEETKIVEKQIIEAIQQDASQNGNVQAD